MKNIKRVLAVLLTFVLMSSLFSVAASAATASTVKKYSYYLSLGDSIPTGFSLASYNRKNHYNRVAGAYPAIVSDAVLADYTYYYAQDGFRTSEIRQLLNDDYNGDLMTDYELPRNTDDYWNRQTLNDASTKYQNAVKNADLITLNIGFNDFWFPILYMSHKLFPEQPLEALINYPTMFLTVLQAAYQEIGEFYINYADIISRIYKLNPNVTVVTLSTYNPIAGWAIPRDSQLAFGQLLNPLYDAMNTFKKSFADQYTNYLYADVSDVEVRTAKLPDPNAGGFDPHPTEAGHRFMAEKVIEVLPVGPRSGTRFRSLTKVNGVWGVYNSDGTMDTSYTGLAKTSKNTWYVKNGQLNKSFSGIYSFQGKKYYVKEGKVRYDFNGTVRTKKYVYTVKKGVVTKQTAR
ncbi:MAG: hypothetical protein IIZ60_05620 [Clostridia bacterium]|nr:hypothetical protein [Clostridia bacterium]